jgi:kynurenine 3-monooxygenase
MTRKAIVVGAGPVGCLSALALWKAGWSVTLYDSRLGIETINPRFQAISDPWNRYASAGE